MKYLDIPHLDRPAAQIFLGTGWFTTPGEDEIFRLLDDYFALGGNAIDTGRFYSGGDTEGVIARWLTRRNMAAKRDTFLLVNKACHHYVDADNVHYPEKNRVTPECITEDLEYSLDNMKQRYFDLYLLHRDNAEAPVEELIDRLERHRREGRIKAYGLSNWSFERVAQAVQYARQQGCQGISVNNPSYSLAAVSSPRWHGCIYADEDYILRHRGTNVALLAWAPQATGYFAADSDDELPEDIRRTYGSAANIEKRRRCRELAERYGVAPTNIALAYVFNRPVPIMASVGARNRRELEEAVAALGIRLSAPVCDWLALRA